MTDAKAFTNARDGSGGGSQVRILPCQTTNEGVCFGMDVPCDPWTAEDIAFWTGTRRYEPWKDVAAFFKTRNNDEEPPCLI